MSDLTQVKEAGITFWMRGGGYQSLDPPTGWFGYSYYSFLIPPFKPKRCLILGVCKNTVGRLIERVHGDGIEFTYVDIRDEDAVDNAGNKIALTQKDALEFLRSMPDDSFDYAVVDLFEGILSPTMIFSEEFAILLGKKCVRFGMNLNVDQLNLIVNYHMRYKKQSSKAIQENQVFQFSRWPESTVEEHRLYNQIRILL